MSGESYYNKSYNISPKVRALIEARMGKQYDMSYVQIENIMSGVAKGEYKSPVTKYTVKDKEKMISLLEETSPNRMNVEIIDNIVLFLNENFEEQETKPYLDYCIKKYYKPGMVYGGIRITNHGVIMMVEKCGIHTLKDGFIINKKFIGDLLPLFGDDTTLFDHDEEITESEQTIIKDDLSDEMVELFNQLKMGYDVDYFMDDDIFIITSNNEESTMYIKETFPNIEIQKILDFTYYEKQVDEVDEDDTMDLGNGIVMKGNFTNIGNVGGTQIIGVGASSGNAVLDELAKEDALDMITRVMNGDMSRCGKDEDDEDDDNDEEDFDVVIKTTELLKARGVEVGFENPVVKTGKNTFMVNLKCNTCDKTEIYLMYGDKELFLNGKLNINTLREIVEEDDYMIDCRGGCNDELHHIKFNGNVYSAYDILSVIINEYDNNCITIEPKNYYFTVQVPPKGGNQDMEPSAICLVSVDFFNKNGCMDDQMGSHSLSSNILKALKDAGIFSECELMEGVWEVTNATTKTKQEIIDSMTKQGFIYNKNIAQ